MNADLLRRLLLPDGPRRVLPAADSRLAAVLVALEPERGVWLTRRSASMPNHAGQVSFPGGKVEAGDGSAEAAALREAHEEIGLEPGDVEILGLMDDYVTGSGFHLTPVVGLVPRGVRFVPSPAEVQEIFCLPFDVLLDPELPELRSGSLRGYEREFYVWPHEEHVIWGATAAILRDLALRLRREM